MLLRAAASWRGVKHLELVEARQQRQLKSGVMGTQLRSTCQVCERPLLLAMEPAPLLRCGLGRHKPPPCQPAAHQAPVGAVAAVGGGKQQPTGALPLLLPLLLLRVLMLLLSLYAPPNSFLGFLNLLNLLLHLLLLLVLLFVLLLLLPLNIHQRLVRPRLPQSGLRKFRVLPLLLSLKLLLLSQRLLCGPGQLPVGFLQRKAVVLPLRLQPALLLLSFPHLKSVLLFELSFPYLGRYYCPGALTRTTYE